MIWHDCGMVLAWFWYDFGMILCDFHMIHAGFAFDLLSPSTFSSSIFVPLSLFPSPVHLDLFRFISRTKEFKFVVGEEEKNSVEGLRFDDFV